MRFFYFLFIGSILLCATTTACSERARPNGSAVVPATTSDFKGIWIEKSEAEELRSTGQLESLCEEMRKDPVGMVSNVRLIDKSGDIYIFVPDQDKTEALKMGTIVSNGVILSPDFQEQLEGGELKVSLKDDALIFTLISGGFDFQMFYLRSTENEAKSYFAAQARCP